MKYIKFSSKEIPQNTEKQLSGKPYVSWGEDNLYSQFLVSLFYKSALQAGIIKNKTLYISGSGFKFKENEQNNAFVTNGIHDKTLQDVVRDLTFDYELFDGFAIKVVRDAANKLSYIDSVGFENLRTDQDQSTIFYSDNWSKTNQDESCNFREYPAFDATILQPVSILYFSNKSKNYDLERNKVASNVYPSPSYVGAIQDILSTIEISSFHYHEVVNSWKSGAIVSFNNGEPDDATKRKMETALKGMVTPTENAGGIFISYNDSKEQAPEVITMNGNDLDKRYLQTDEAIKKNIFIASSVTSPSLFGVSESGALGNKNELEVAFEIFVKTYVRERQNAIDMVVNVLASSLGFDLGFKLNEPESPFTTESQAGNDLAITETEESRFSEEQDIENKIIELARTLGSEDPTDAKLLFSEEAEELEEVRKSKFALTPLEVRFLQIFLTNNNVKAIADSLGIPYRDIVAIYDKLEKEGYLEEGALTLAGIALIKTLKDEIPLEPRYKYKLRPNVPLVAGSKGSRPFCASLMAIFSSNPNLSFTREDIEKLNGATPLGNVFKYRGGWYTKPGTNLHQKGCRHFWEVNNFIR